MGFLRPKEPVPPLPPPPPPALPPATAQEQYKTPDGKMTTADTEAAKKMAKKKKGYTETIMTSTEGDTSTPDIYKKTLLGA
tara:strand:- start:732 stop:974 length:243 start_codon:yes stop_codon:yes gene_type:complete